ncbi:MAG: sensor histidine kinase [Acidimicrobiales bacterium]
MSLRSRLLLAVGAVALVALVAADFATYSSLRSFLYDRIDTSLDTAHPALETALDSGQPLSLLTVARLAPGMFVEVRDPAGNVLFAIAAYQRGGQPITPALPAHIGGLKVPPNGLGEPVTYFTAKPAQSGGPDFRVRVSLLAGGGQLILALPLDQTASTLHRLVLVELVVTAVAMLAAAILGWWLVRIGLRPLRDVEKTAEAISAGQLDRRVPGASANTEVGRVAGALNTMLGNIEEAFAERDATEAQMHESQERLRRFVADASHELRTPLAAVGAYAELFDRGAGERPEDLSRVMHGIMAETSRMGRLVEDLLLLARLDEGRPLEREKVDLVELAAESISAAGAVGPDWPVHLRAEGPVEVTGDASRLRQVLDNLLANVRAHTPPGTSAWVTVAIDAGTCQPSIVPAPLDTTGSQSGTGCQSGNGEPGPLDAFDAHHGDLTAETSENGDLQARVEVTDDGPGMTPDQAARVFERFYRADPSRSRALGGSGLGLAIVAAIVAAHGGTAHVTSSPGKGTTFTVRLPVAGPHRAEPCTGVATSTHDPTGQMATGQMATGQMAAGHDAADQSHVAG